jgi:uncharacterized protein YerC
MYSAYWQVKITPEDKMKTAFSTPSGHYHFQKLSYGLSNSPSSLQRLMDVILRNLTGEFCYVFIDDMLVFVDTIEHARRLHKVLQRFEKANLLHPGKCTYALPQVNYLGYVVSRDGVTASPRKYAQSGNIPYLRT